MWKCENSENILSLQHFQDFLFSKKTPPPPRKVGAGKENWNALTCVPRLVSRYSIVPEAVYYGLHGSSFVAGMTYGPALLPVISGS
jgi:hypothetical protein